MVSFIFLIASCKEKDTTPPQPLEVKTNKDVELVDGVLKFSSRDHLNRVVKEITNKDDMSNWYSDNGFTSLLKRQKSITAAQYDEIGKTGEFGSLADLLVFRGNGENKILEKIVDDPRFAAVLSSKGYVIVSDTIYQIGIDKVASIKMNGDKSILTKFLKNVDFQGVSFTKIVNEPVKNARIQDDFQDTYGKRRIIAEFKHHNAGIYHSLVVRVRYLKKNWVGWSGTEAPYLSFTASGTYWTGYSNNIPFQGSRSGRDVEEVSMFVDEAYHLMGWGRSTGHMYCETPHENYSKYFSPE